MLTEWRDEGLVIMFIIVLSILFIYVLIKLLKSKNKGHKNILTETLMVLIVIGIIAFSINQAVESSKDNAKLNKEYEIKVEEYLKNSVPKVSYDIIIRDVSVIKEGELEFKVIMKDGNKYKEERVTSYEESLSNEEDPYIEYVELKEDVVHSNKGKKFIKLFIPEGYLYNNK